MTTEVVELACSWRNRTESPHPTGVITQCTRDSSDDPFSVVHYSAKKNGKLLSDIE